MNNIFRNSIANSRAVFDPFMHTSGHTTPFSVFSQYTALLQSSAVTSNGFLWQQTLANMAYENLPITAQNELKSNDVSKNSSQMQKNHALIQLLRSWREGDKQEQQDTWEYLEHALDEDRFSERKLFP